MAEAWWPEERYGHLLAADVLHLGQWGLGLTDISWLVGSQETSGVLTTIRTTAGPLFHCYISVHVIINKVWPEFNPVTSLFWVGGAKQLFPVQRELEQPQLAFTVGHSTLY